MARSLFRQTTLLYGAIAILLILVLLLVNDRCPTSPSQRERWGQGERVPPPAPAMPPAPQAAWGLGDEPVAKRKEILYGSQGGVMMKDYEYGTDMPLIFIGGVPRSGTTLMRAMLDAHPHVRCGEETRVIPRILGMRAQWKRSQKEAKRLAEAGITDYVLDSAISAFMLEVIVKHGQPSERLCNKDPFTMKSMVYLAKLFPNAKFILMIRDGRATVNSIISRKVTITGFDHKNPRQCLQKWNDAIKNMYSQCTTVGEERCFAMYYEQLVLHPEKHLRELTDFLDLPWNASVLNHEQFIGKEISLSKVERSSDQVIKPVNTDALTKWVGFFPDDVLNDMPQIAPMLAQLGYDPMANPPNYGKADDFVLRKTSELHQNDEQWNQRVKTILDRDAIPDNSPNKVQIGEQEQRFVQQVQQQFAQQRNLDSIPPQH